MIEKICVNDLDHRLRMIGGERHVLADSPFLRAHCCIGGDDGGTLFMTTASMGSLMKRLLLSRKRVTLLLSM